MLPGAGGCDRQHQQQVVVVMAVVAAHSALLTAVAVTVAVAAILAAAVLLPLPLLICHSQSAIVSTPQAVTKTARWNSGGRVAIGAAALPVFLSRREALTPLGQWRFLVLLTYLLDLVSRHMLSYMPKTNPYSVPPRCLCGSLRCGAYGTFCYGMS